MIPFEAGNIYIIEILNVHQIHQLRYVSFQNNTGYVNTWANITFYRQFKRSAGSSPNLL